MSRWRDLRDISLSGEADWVYVPCADHVAQVSALLGQTGNAPVEGLLLRARFAYKNDRARDALLSRASLRSATHTPWRTLFFLDPLATESLNRDAPNQQFTLMPEPVEQLPIIPRSVARERLGLPDVAHLFVLAGVINERKGALHLAHAFARADLGSRAGLAIVGKVDDAVRLELESIARRTSSIVIVDGVVSAERFWAALCSADTICAPYVRHVGSSGILVRAASLGTPLLASDYGWVGEATRRYDLGLAVDSTNPSALAAAIVDLVDRTTAFVQSDAARDYVNFNTARNFTSTWLEGILHSI